MSETQNTEECLPGPASSVHSPTVVRRFGATAASVVALTEAAAGHSICRSQRAGAEPALATVSTAQGWAPPPLGGTGFGVDRGAEDRAATSPLQVLAVLEAENHQNSSRIERIEGYVCRTLLSVQI